jgi:hypothetical protein
MMQGPTAYDSLFKSHKMKPNAFERSKDIGEAFDLLVERIKFAAGMGSREWAVTLEHLEAACFYAKKSWASQPGNAE